MQPKLKCGTCLLYTSWFEGDYFVSTQCGHIFHFECISQWILANGNRTTTECPLCEGSTNLKSLIHLQGIDPTDIYITSHNDRKCIMYKIALIGDSGSGKSSLLQTFTKGVFPPDIISTCGCDVSFKTVEFNDKIVKLSIWDCGGQDRFAAITPNFLRNVEGILLIYDITRLDSFENRKKWLHFVKNYAPIGSPIILVGNKSDLEESRQVSTELAKSVSESGGMNFMETSALMNGNIEAVFRLLVGTILEKNWRQHDANDNTYSLQLSEDNIKGKRSKSCAC